MLVCFFVVFFFCTYHGQGGLIPQYCILLSLRKTLALRKGSGPLPRGGHIPWFLPYMTYFECICVYCFGYTQVLQENNTNVYKVQLSFPSLYFAFVHAGCDRHVCFKRLVQ